jgi:hypothetical protein
MTAFKTLLARSVLTLFLFVGLGAAAFGQSIEGAYALQGMGTDKTTYAGRVEVTKSGAGFQVRWVYSDGSTVFGAGLMEGDTLSIGTVEDRKSIVSLMKRQADGGFKGVWYQRGEAALGDETWIKQ